MKITNLPESFLASVPQFTDYLRAQGCEIRASTNEYELVRFRCALGIGVLYVGKSGLSCNMPFVSDAIDLFLAGKQAWQAGKITGTKRDANPARKRNLLARDGNRCWLCNLPLEGDITEEHLVPLAQHGPNSLDNIVLTHFKCNEALGHKALVDKIKLRDQMRNP